MFNHKALAKVFRAKVLDAVKAAGLTLPDKLPSMWVVDCKCVGNGSQALLYLGRYLYRGVIQEADILSCKAGLVTFRYRDAKTAKSALHTLPGADFLWLVLQHVLPRGLRRSRNFGFLHPNSAKSVRLLQVLHLRAAPSVGKPTAPLRAAWRCDCGKPMRVMCRRMPAQEIVGDGRSASSHTTWPRAHDDPQQQPWRRSDRVDALKKHRRPTVTLAREPFTAAPLAFAQISAKASINSGRALSARPRQSPMRAIRHPQRRSGR